MKNDPIRINDTACVLIPTKECGEEMVGLLDIDRVFLLDQTKVSSQNIFGNSKSPLARITVKNLLRKAIESLPSQYGVVLIESYRDYNFQKRLFRDRVEDLMKQNKISREIAEVEASLFVSNPDIYSPHVTGGAIDIGLIHLDSKELLEMGNNLDYNESARTDYLNLSTSQKGNRQLLFKVMTESGFVNYPFEWWHWSYGDKYWAMVKEKPFAIYDSLKTI
ncbi:hypothetical protein A2572_01155 [Candidatus Collierbacteria bacterium RIFOXYD1_FULL_40_9]|uniref:D-Ala-D-Ala dipeptidase n=1 Tax=Candidatus Collierbacteria bacterium RIFOXYD1_FULL_40_9 TaxID=1817731 RepID=A0A1F5FP62_9BACT|nr:MAG: hypothetical protein A2572_01155 [Candidatus Collierbacteria bacterium RIFOXYD1_FULL_40_9]